MMTPPRGPKPDSREKNLPQYVQKLLNDYRQTIEQWVAYAIAARLETDPDKTNTIAAIHADHPIGLPTGDPVRFRMPGGDRRRDTPYIDARMSDSDDGWVLISAGDLIEVRPQAGNCFLVRQVPYDNR